MNLIPSFQAAMFDLIFAFLQRTFRTFRDQLPINLFCSFFVDKILTSELPVAIPRKERSSRKSDEIELIHRQASVEER